MTKLQQIFAQNARWAAEVLKDDPHFFKQLSSIQRPEYLWIGCSDSRVPANQITGLLPGQVFVHRNVGNIVSSTDLNCLSVLQYAVEILGVKDVIVCGHYGCGAVRAVCEKQKHGLIDYWLSAIKSVREKNHDKLETVSDPEANCDLLCELNVLEQARNLCHTNIVQEAWASGMDLTVHAWIYGLKDGLLRDLGLSVSSAEECEA